MVDCDAGLVVIQERMTVRIALDHDADSGRSSALSLPRGDACQVRGRLLPRGLRRAAIAKEAPDRADARQMHRNRQQGPSVLRA